MLLDIREEGPWTVLTPQESDFDVHSVPSFKKCVTDLAERRRFEVILDLNNVQHVDTAGLGAMVFALRLVEGKGSIVLCGIHEAFLALLKTTGLDRVFRIADSPEDVISTPCEASALAQDEGGDG